jgi:hypothetical protein
MSYGVEILILVYHFFAILTVKLKAVGLNEPASTEQPVHAHNLLRPSL